MNYNANFNPRISDLEIFEAIKKEKQEIGYYNLPFQDTTHIKEYAKTVKQKDIAVIGIGGSTLGTYAIYRFLTRTHNFDKRLHFFESTDPIDINSRLERLDLDNTLFIVISKSGTTIETISVFKYLYSKVKIDKKNCLVITESDSKLNDFALANEIKSFEVPKNVGGRFSVFSTVGLVPLAIIGVDIDETYVNITKSKLSKESSSSKVGNAWVSFYLDKIVTIRDTDWVKLARYFLIPKNIKEIDFTKIKFKK